MPPGIRIKRRNPNEPMNARLCPQMAVGVGPLNGKGCTFYATAFTRQVFGHLYAIATAFRPAQIEPEEHIGPVLGLKTTGPRMETDDGTLRIVFSTQHALQLCPTHGRLKLGHRPRDFFNRFGVSSFGQFQKNQRVRYGLRLLFPLRHRVEQACSLLEDGLCLFLILPESVGQRLFFQCGGPGFLVRDVKDASQDSQCVRSTHVIFL